MNQAKSNTVTVNKHSGDMTVTLESGVTVVSEDNWGYLSMMTNDFLLLLKSDKGPEILNAMLDYELRGRGIRQS